MMDGNINGNKLECRRLTKKYGKQEVLSQIDLTLEKGKIYGLIGRNDFGWKAGLGESTGS